MKRLMSLIVLTSLLTIGYARKDSLSQQILVQLKSEQIRMFEMFSNGDVKTFKLLSGDDYLTINADGTYMDKAQTFDLIPKFKGSTYKISEQTDRVYGYVVISTGRAKFYFGSFLVADIYFNQTWIYRSGSWQFINWQGTMTGISKYYPIFLTLLLTIVTLGIILWIYRRKKRRN